MRTVGGASHYNRRPTVQSETRREARPDFPEEHFHAVCDAEDTLTRMEREGITSGEAYEQTCRDLLVKFEAARRLKLSHEFRLWLQ